MLRYVLSVVAALAMSATAASATSYDIDLTSAVGIAGTGGAISVNGCVGPCETGGFLTQAFSVKAGDNVNFGSLDLLPVVFDFTAGGRNPNTYEVVAAPELEVLFYDGTIVQPMSISLGSVLDQCAITNASECNQLASIATLISARLYNTSGRDGYSTRMDRPVHLHGGDAAAWSASSFQWWHFIAGLRRSPQEDTRSQSNLI